MLEAGLTPELVKVDLKTRITDTGQNFLEINPKGVVPALVIEDGELLTEGAAVLQYLADHYAPELVPANGTLARTRLQEMLNYLASEYHKSWTPLVFLAPGAERTEAERAVIAKQSYLNALFADGRDYILGNRFTVADAYLFVVTRWSSYFGITLERYSGLDAFMVRVGGRTAVKAAIRAEGLDKC